MGGFTSDGTAELAEQHRVIQRGLGFDLHPTIRESLANGSGILRIAEVYPGGAPKNARNPFPGALYERISVKMITTTKDVDGEQKGRFHVVVVRLLHTALPNDAWDGAIQGLVSLLRPGGWLQWEDFDPLTARIAGARPGSTDAVLRDVLQRYRDDLQARQVGATYRIPNSLRSAGLVDEDSDMYPLSPEVSFTRSVAHGALRSLQSSGAATQHEARDLDSKLDEEITTGSPLLWYDLWCHIARKPTEVGV